MRWDCPSDARYWWTKAIAMLPSPTAEATRLTGLSRTSPHAEHPARSFRADRDRGLRPAPGLHRVVAGLDIAAGIARDLGRQPPGLGVGSNEDEKAAAVVPAHLLGGASRMSMAVRWVSPWTACTSERSRTVDVRFPAQLLDQVMRHALLQGIAADDERHLAGMVGRSAAPPGRRSFRHR